MSDNTKRVGNWSTSKYRQKRAERQANKTPEWIMVPSGVQFYLRKVGMMAYAIAGHMPRGLSADALDAWKERGIDAGEETETPTTAPVEDGQRNVVLMARILQEACVLPKLTTNPQNDDELDPADLDDDDVLFIVRYATGQMGSVTLEGGQVMSMTNLKSVPKKPGRRVRTGTSG
jgi:hypothetical protein